MAAAGGVIKVWVKYAKDELKDIEDESKDDRDESETDPFEMKEITLQKDMTSKAIKMTLLEAFSISLENQVVKLRNARGNLIPINGQLTENSPKKAYCLEVCKQYSAVKPRPRTVSVPTYEQLLRRRLQNVNQRLLKLEQTVPKLPEIRNEIIDKDIIELGNKMDFLNFRIKAADDYQWKGMFQKNPLW
eukprot:Seg3868.1 transcript_id=Seg3868.1/GoldUCD/mRNA.D3Y31 product="hypothetical protein" protein_id=Seg3868.1/GoldUCD/D3Y31